MKKIDVVIVEDNEEEMDLLEQALIAHDFNIVDKINNLEDGIQCINTKSFDLMIIDIYLDGEPTGIKLAEELNKKFQFQKPFIFLSGYSDRAIFERTKNAGPHSYLLKPFNELELHYAIELTIEKYTNARKEAAEPGSGNFFPLIIKKRGIFHKIEKEDVVYIEVEGRYCSIRTLETNFLIRSTLNDMAKQLPEADFIRTHRRYIVNLNAIEKVHINDNLIVLKDNNNVSLGRAYKSGFLEKYDAGK